MSTDRDDFYIAFRSAFLQKGAQQRFSLLFLIFLSALILVLDSFNFKVIKSARSILKDGIYSVSTIASFPGKFIVSGKDSVKQHFFLYENYKTVKEENLKLKQEEYNSKFLKQENKLLKNIIDEKYKTSQSKIIGKIIVDKNSPFQRSVVINRGSKDGLQIGLAVLGDQNLIGRIVEVNYFSSRVLLLNDLNSRIPVVIEPESYQAILTGTNENYTSINFLPNRAKLKENDIIFTSGKDGIFFPGIPIGRVKTTDNLSKEKTNYIVELFSDVNQLKYITVITEKYIKKEY